LQALDILFGLWSTTAIAVASGVRHTVRALVNDRDRSRLAEENLELRVKNQNAEIAGIQLKNRVAKLEARARQIEEILEEQLLPNTPEAAAADKDKQDPSTRGRPTEPAVDSTGNY
jgi:hypothetical protein